MAKIGFEDLEWDAVLTELRVLFSCLGDGHDFRFVGTLEIDFTWWHRTEMHWLRSRWIREFVFTFRLPVLVWVTGHLGSTVRVLPGKP